MDLLPRTHCRSRQPKASCRHAEGLEHPLWNECGKPELNSKHLKRLEEVGRHIHAGGQPFVFDGGRVGLSQCDYEDNEDEQRQAAFRPPARSREGQRARSGPRAGARSYSDAFSSGALEAAFGTEFRVLVRQYKAVKFEEKDGFWVVIKAKPFGFDGPQAHILLAVPSDRSILPKAWAFEAVGTQPRAFPPKHTNFPDGSICAFDPKRNVWNSSHGLLALVDHYAVWLVKSWHRTILGWWPGGQDGVCAFYRRREFVPNELCGCGSGVAYGLCHRQADIQMPEADARQQFKNWFGCDYFERRVPDELLIAAKSSWRHLPEVMKAFSDKPRVDPIRGPYHLFRLPLAS